MMRMRNRIAAFALLAVMLVSALAMPAFDHEEADALEPTDYKVSLPGYIRLDDAIDVEIGNGHSKTFVIYIQNYTDHVLDVAFYSVEGTTDVYGDELRNITLMPAGDKDGKDLVKQEYKITVKEVTPSHKDARVVLGIFVTDLQDDSWDQTVLKFNVDVVSSFDTSGSFNKFLGLIDNTLPEPFSSPYFPFIVTLIIFLGVGVLVLRILVPTLSRLLKEDTFDEDYKRFKRMLTLGVVAITLVLFIDPGLRIVGADLNALYVLHKIAMTMLIIVLAIIIWKIYMMVMEHFLRKMGTIEDSKFDLTLLPLFGMFGKLFLWLGGIGSVLHIYGLDLSSILISAGIVTLGITLGAQSILSQAFSGVMLLLTRPFSKGDYLNINGDVLIVRNVKVMYTEFVGMDKDRVITMPNNAVSAATIVNMSKYNKHYRLQIYFQIPYEVDVKKAEEVMLQVAEESPHVMHDYTKYQKPSVKLIDFLDSGVQMRLDVTIQNYSDYPTLQSNLKKDLYAKLAENGIYAPYNRLEVTILSSTQEPDTNNPAGS